MHGKVMSDGDGEVGLHVGLHPPPLLTTLIRAG
jgi:hypothetical protein